MRITIKTGSLCWNGEIHNTPTGKQIIDALPIKGVVSRWGEEIYFSIPVDVELEPNAQEVVCEGDLGYWPTGNAFCIFFGPTPASRGNEIRAASPVNVFGSIKGDLKSLSQVKSGAEIVIAKSDGNF